MIKYSLLFFSFLFTFHLSTAQNPSKKNVQPNAIYMKNPLQINVDNPNPTENLLVVISDSSGQTIFLDNRFHFTGLYTKSIDLSRSGKGPYSLCIAKDSERSVTRFYLK